MADTETPDLPRPDGDPPEPHDAERDMVCAESESARMKPSRRLERRIPGTVDETNEFNSIY